MVGAARSMSSEVLCGAERTLLAFEDVAVYFSDEEWALLDEKQKEVYKNTMRENYETLLSLGLSNMKPEIIAKIDAGEAPSIRNASCLEEQERRSAAGRGSVTIVPLNKALLAGIEKADMQQASSSLIQNSLQQIEESQAVNNDYRNSGFTRGHLNPSQHHSSEAQIATFTYTNMAPQESTLNSGSWNQYENFLRNSILPACSEIHVVTGVIPSGTTPEEGVWIRGRVNVPSFFWSAFYCQQKNGGWHMEARLGRNTSPFHVQTKTVSELEEILATRFGENVNIFPGASSSEE